MKRPNIRADIVLLMAGLLFACRSTLSDSTQPSETNVAATKWYSCPTLSPTFKESDLIGTWVASYSLNDQDILTLKADGTYKQIYDDPDAGQRYESDWREWWIERRDSGYVRLHLEGMRRAGDLESIFSREGGGIDPQLLTAIDYCEGEVIEMPAEMVLIVTGSKDDTPRGIILRQARLAGSEWTWSFHLEDEK